MPYTASPKDAYTGLTSLEARQSVKEYYFGASRVRYSLTESQNVAKSRFKGLL